MILIVHIGASKCGSSTIQYALKILKRSSNFSNKYDYKFINPLMITGVVSKDVKAFECAKKYFVSLFRSSSCNSIPLIISHEFFIYMPHALDVIFQLSKKFGYRSMKVIGYSRLQSAHGISSFKQWGFRDKSFIANNICFLEKMNINWRLFSALERYMIWQSFNLDTQSRKSDCRNWYFLFSNLVKNVGEISLEDVSISSNHIPSKDYPYDLVRDFLVRCDIDLNSFDLEQVDDSLSVQNKSFSPLLTEIISLSIIMPKFDFGLRIHKDNQKLIRLSNVLDEQFVGNIPKVDSSLAFISSSLIDSHFLSDNKKYCQVFGAEEKYFCRNIDKRLTCEDLMSHVRVLESKRIDSDYLESWHFVSIALLDKIQKLEFSN